MPGYKEIMSLTGYKSKNAVYKLINKLVEAGIVFKDKEGRLTPNKSFGEIPMLGLVEAGFPETAEEYVFDTLSLDEYLIENKEASYILKIKGDSMKDAGILPNDIVLVERKNEAKDGEIVIAEVDGNWTMKYFRKRGKEIYLEAANSKFKKIFPKEDLKIAAVVKAVIRKYS